jgi:hypothetical protein
LSRAETDRRFYDRLAGHCRRLRPLVAPARERSAWARLLADVTRGPRQRK